MNIYNDPEDYKDHVDELINVKCTDVCVSESGLMISTTNITKLIKLILMLFNKVLKSQYKGNIEFLALAIND